MIDYMLERHKEKKKAEVGVQDLLITLAPENQTRKQSLQLADAIR